MGNEATCTAQGFFLELGVIGSISYNFVLCVYYLLVIKYGKREDELKRVQKYLHLFPIVIALAFAFSAVDEYEFSIMVCTLASPPAKDSWKYSMIYLIGPLLLSILGVTVVMAMIYVHVRRTSQNARRWNFQRTQGSSISEQPSSLSSASLSGNIKKLFRKGRDGDCSTATGASNRMETAVFWQSCFFLIVFYFTYGM